MSKASSQADARTEPWIDRLQPWIAAFSSALLHVLLVLLALSSEPITVTTPQGAAAGGRTEVTFIDKASQPPPPGPATRSTPAPRKPRPDPKPAQTPPAASRIQSTQVPRADDPVPPEAAAPSEQTAPDIPDDAWQDIARAPAASSPKTSQYRPRTWGQPPGLLREDHAPVNAGLARSPAIDRGRRNDAAAAEPNLEVGGYQVYYDLRNENRLRAWRDQGMTELFLPLPGTQKYMICPLEIALRRSSGPCRLLEPDSPELKSIGDAREVITMQQVYRQGELVWRGPGPYR